MFFLSVIALVYEYKWCSLSTVLLLSKCNTKVLCLKESCDATIYLSKDHFEVLMGLCLSLSRSFFPYCEITTHLECITMQIQIIPSLIFALALQWKPYLAHVLYSGPERYHINSS